MRIGIMGAPVNNPNHGCMALAYSLVADLNEIEKKLGKNFEYVFFDWIYEENKFEMMADILNIDRKKLIYAPYTLKDDLVHMLYHCKKYMQMKAEIKKCDCIIDVTEGDSFSDIYGDRWFVGRTRIKLMIEKMGIPLMLAPQTYGPFMKDRNKKLAVKSIKKADIVLARDKKSLDLIKELTNRNAEFTTDLAFLLPYGETISDTTNKVKVGINFSYLLSCNDEMKNRKFSLSLDYEKYMELLTERLLQENFEIHLISHVDSDYEVHKKIKEKYPKIKLADKLSNPIEAKTYISKMDVFIGARMHGTIAAFTTGVAVIPTAYSEKFANLFRSLSYEPLVDLTKLEIDEAVELTLNYTRNYKKLKMDVSRCILDNQEIIESTKTKLLEWVEHVGL